MKSNKIINAFITGVSDAMYLVNRVSALALKTSFFNASFFRLQN